MPGIRSTASRSRSDRLDAVIIGPDDLSGWAAAAPAARDGGEVELLRVLDSAEAAMAFLARHVGRGAVRRRPQRLIRSPDAGPRLFSDHQRAIFST
jgi:hypothetical protein